MPDVEIRRIRTDEWQELRELRLGALLDAPDAFGSTHDREASDPEDAWRDWAAQGAEGGSGFAAIAVGDGGWVGIAVGAPHREHPGDVGLFAMWVDPSGPVVRGSAAASLRRSLDGRDQRGSPLSGSGSRPRTTLRSAYTSAAGSSTKETAHHCARTRTSSRCR